MLIFLSFPPSFLSAFHCSTSDPSRCFRLFHRRSPRMPSDPLQNRSRGHPRRAPCLVETWPVEQLLPDANRFEGSSESAGMFRKKVPIQLGPSDVYLVCTLHSPVNRVCVWVSGACALWWTLPMYVCLGGTYASMCTWWRACTHGPLSLRRPQAASLVPAVHKSTITTQHNTTR